MKNRPRNLGPQGPEWLRLPQPIPRWWIVFALLGLLLLARQPDDFIHPVPRQALDTCVLLPVP